MNVDKGSRQNRSGTSGKGLALKTGSRGPLSKTGLDSLGARTAFRGGFGTRESSGRGLWNGEGLGFCSASSFFPRQLTVNSELFRTRELALKMDGAEADGLYIAIRAGM